MIGSAAHKPYFVRGEANEYLLQLQKISTRNSDDMQHATWHNYRRPVCSEKFTINECRQG